MSDSLTPETTPLSIRHLASFRNLAAAGQAWLHHECARFGAAIAFYTMFSLAPILVIATVIAGSVFGREAVQGQLVLNLQQVVGPDAARLLQEMIANAYLSQGSTLATLLSAGVLLFGASAIFAELRQIFERIWGYQQPERNAILSFLLLRLRGVVLVVGIGFLLLLSLIASSVFVWLRDQMVFFDAATALIASILKLPLSVLFTTGLFMLMMGTLIPGKIHKRLLFLGSLLSAMLFELGKIGIGFYLKQAAISATFGAAGSLAVLLVWIFYVAVILLFGAEFTAVLHKAAAGSRQTASKI